MKKLTPKAKKVTIITSAAVVCVGVLCVILIQNHAIADSSNLPAATSVTSASASIASDVSIAPISGNGAVVSGTAGTGSAWTPSSGKTTSAPLTPSVSKPQTPSKPTVQGDSQNGKQPTNDTLTNKATKPSYTTPPKAPTQKSSGKSSGGTTIKKQSNGGSTNKSGGSTTGGFDTHKAWGTGGQETIMGGDHDSHDNDQVGIMD